MTIENQKPEMENPLRLAVLISGGGRTLQNLIDRSRAGTLKARVVKVISSLRSAYGLERARNAGIPTAVVRRRDFTDTASFSAAITAELQECSADAVVLGGFMCFYEIPQCYAGRVMNIHPALLPSFGGKGYYGERVHNAVLQRGCKVSGCTVHLVDNVYDHGPIVVQKTVPVLEGDDAHALSDRVFAQELEAMPEAINLMAEGRLELDGDRVRILPSTEATKREDVPALRKIKLLDELLAILAERRARGEKMAFTNGCFDLLHLGHLDLMRFARSQGDFLVVGLNTDRSVRELKGPTRPVNNQEVRSRILAGLEDVDYVVLFDTESVLPLIKQVRPDVLVKGGDYPKTGVVGWDFVEGYGGRVALAPQVEGLSTTDIIQRISQGDEGRDTESSN